MPLSLPAERRSRERRAAKGEADSRIRLRLGDAGPVVKRLGAEKPTRKADQGDSDSDRRGGERDCALFPRKMVIVGDLLFGAPPIRRARSSMPGRHLFDRRQLGFSHRDAHPPELRRTDKLQQDFIESGYKHEKTGKSRGKSLNFFTLDNCPYVKSSSDAANRRCWKFRFIRSQPGWSGTPAITICLLFSSAAVEHGSSLLRCEKSIGGR